jgi:hypothetical protein
VIDMSKVVGDIVFPTHRERSLYLSKTNAERAAWRAENAVRLHYVNKSDAPINPPVELEKGAVQLAATADANEPMPAFAESEIIVGSQPMNDTPLVEASINSDEKHTKQDTMEPGAVDLLRKLAPDRPWLVRTISSLEGGSPQFPKKLGYHVGPPQRG